MEYSKKILKNGTRVVLAPNTSTETITIQILVEAGSKYENLENNGISHFLEHMIFKGTKKRPTSQIISEELDSVGGEFNAFTSKEQTGYWVKVPKQHLKLALDVVSDIYLNSTLKQEEIDKERGVILQEMAMYKDMPIHYIWDVFESLFYGNQPAGWDIIGTTENLNRFQRKDFVDYLKNFYIPKSTVVIVAGNFNPEIVSKLIEKYFEKNLKSPEKIGKLAVSHNQKRPQLKVYAKETDQTHLVLGVKSVDMFSEDRYIASLLATVLGGGMSSRLFDELREKRGLTYYVNAGTEPYTDSGYFYASAGVEHKNLEKTITLILAEFKKTAQKKISEKEINKVKEYIKGKTLMSLESSSSVASFLGDQELFKNQINTPEEIFRKIDLITANDLSRVANDIFKNDNLNLAVIGPHEKNENLEKYLKF